MSPSEEGAHACVAAELGGKAEEFLSSTNSHTDYEEI
jgi:hypothetical protein